MYFFTDVVEVNFVTDVTDVVDVYFVTDVVDVYFVLVCTLPQCIGSASV